jgi:gas vesicle protein
MPETRKSMPTTEAQIRQRAYEINLSRGDEQEDQVYDLARRRTRTYRGERARGHKLEYFLGGLGIGALVGLLFAPRSGEESRDYLNRRVEEAKEYAQHKAREIRERAEDVVERGKQILAEQKEIISEAVDAGVEAYQREKSKEPI